MEFSDYIAGGYVLKRLADRENRSVELLPERLASLSRCVCDSFEFWRVWNQQDTYGEWASAFGVTNDVWNNLVSWCVGKWDTEIGYPDIFYTLDVAHEFSGKFIKQRPQDVMLVGIGLHKGFLDRWVAEDFGLKYGIEQMIAQTLPLAQDGQALGYEVVSCNYGLGCSWLCSGIEADAYREYGIRPTDYGLLNTLDEAKKIISWIDEAPGERAEPEVYFPWLLVEYPVMGASHG